MSAHSVAAGLAENIFPSEGKVLYVKDKGFLFGWGLALSTDPVWAKGALFIVIDGAADANIHVNEAAAGEGTAPTWTAQTT